MKIVNKSSFVKMFNIGILQVGSGSMEPTLSIGEIIIIMEKEYYYIGDIISFYAKEKNILTTHRIIEKRKEGFVTKGDFNNIKDEEIINKENIEGKVIFHSKVLGIAFKYYSIFILIFIFFIVIKK